MCNSAIEKYKELSARLSEYTQAKEQAELASILQNLSGLLTQEEKENNHLLKMEKVDRDEFNRSETALLVFMVHYGIELYRQGFSEYRNQCVKDLSELAKAFQSWTWYPDNIASETLFDMILCLGQDDEPLLRALWLEQRPQSHPELISADSFSAIMRVGSWYLEQELTQEAALLFQGLVRLSRERHRFRLNRHRELVVHLLADIASKLPDSAIEICQRECAVMTSTEDRNAHNYYWSYGIACLISGKYEKSRAVFRRCWELRCKESGPEDWYSQVARVYYVLAELDLGERNEESLAFLRSFVEEAEAGRFCQVDKGDVTLFEGIALRKLLVTHQDQFCLAEDYELLILYHHMCEEHNDSLRYSWLKLRYSCNLLGAYYLELGDFIQSEEWIRRAINAPFPPELEPEAMLNRIQLKCSLLVLYTAQHDDECFIPLAQELLEDDAYEALGEEDSYRFFLQLNAYYMRNQIPVDEEFLELSVQELEKAYTDLVENPEPSEDRLTTEYGVFLLSCIMLLVDNQEKSLDYQLIDDLLQAIESYSNRLSFGPQQYALLYFLWGGIRLDRHDARGEMLLNKGLQIASEFRIEPQIYAALLRTTALSAVRQGKLTVASDLVQQAFSQLTDRWHAYTRYCNDQRLQDALYETYMMALMCYGIQRLTDNMKSSYETVLRFKSLASLAGRERNRIVQTYGMDSKLIQEIQTIQNRLAVMETGSLFRNAPADMEKEKDRLRELEAEFSRRFPKGVDFTEISTDRVLKAIPDDSAVIEYYYCGDIECTLRNPVDDNGIVPALEIFDVYLTTKRRGVPSLRRIVLTDADELLESAGRFVGILQRESLGKASEQERGEKEQLKESLYNRLVKPLLIQLNGIRTLYIAPDQDLMNLPFEILGNQEEGPLGERFELVHMECARDFLFSAPGTPVFGSLIIGNPDYGARDFQLKPERDSHTRSPGIDPMDIHPLPFSEREAMNAARWCGTQCLTGAEATKKALVSRLMPKNIHIATHGSCDLESETNALYSSCLLMAGVKTWLATGRESVRYGNGILTADEVSRMNLRGVELVVLSSCLSGMNDSQWNKGLQGLLGSFAAAGVGYVVTHLWSADDFATAVLMSAFYQAYCRYHLSPPRALHYAKIVLCNTTLSDLERAGWLDYALSKEGVCEDTRKTVRGWKMMVQRGFGNKCPFAKEAYWGGFSCYQCRAI